MSKADIQIAFTAFVCPIRRTRSSAWRVSPGVHGRSRRMIVLAAVKVNPTPPAPYVQTKTGDSPSCWKNKIERIVLE